MQPLVVLVDLQRDFFDTAGSSIASLEKALCLGGVRQLVAHARGLGWQLAHVVTEHSAADTLPRPLKRRNVPVYCKAGTEGAQIVSGLYVDGETRITKRAYSAFSTGELKKHLPGHDTVILAGVAFDCCVLNSAFDAVWHDCDVIIPYQSVGCSSKDLYVAAAEMIGKSVGTVCDLGDVIAGNDVRDRQVSVSVLRERVASWYEETSERARPLRDAYTNKIRVEGLDAALAWLDAQMTALGR